MKKRTQFTARKSLSVAYTKRRKTISEGPSTGTGLFISSDLLAQCPTSFNCDGHKKTLHEGEIENG
jgi:hypothetical protein